MATTKIPPFRIHFSVSVDCMDFERLPDETIEYARRALINELRDGFKQTAYEAPWEIEESSIEELDDSDAAAFYAGKTFDRHNDPGMLGPDGL